MVGSDFGRRLESDLDRDQRLVRRIAAGDSSALAALYDTHADMIHAIIMRVVHDHQIAEDLLQESFLRVWQHARSYDGNLGRVRAWLYGIAHNLALNELRRRRRRPQEATPVGGFERSIESVASPGADPADTAWAHSRQDRVANALASLSPAQQAVLSLYASGHSQSEIADTLNEPLGTIKSRMRRSLHSLREALAQEGFDVEL